MVTYIKSYRASPATQSVTYRPTQVSMPSLNRNQTSWHQVFGIKLT